MPYFLPYILASEIQKVEENEPTPKLKKTLKYARGEAQNSFWLTTTRSTGQADEEGTYSTLTCRRQSIWRLLYIRWGIGIGDYTASDLGGIIRVSCRADRGEST